MNIKCNECGRFCKLFDYGYYYGGVLDVDPPEEPIYFCKKCVRKLKKHPEKIVFGCWWIKPNFINQLEKSFKK